MRFETYQNSHTVALFCNDAFIQFEKQTVENDIVIVKGGYVEHVDA